MADGRMEIRDSEMFSRYYLDKDALEKRKFRDALGANYEARNYSFSGSVSNINSLTIIA